MFYNDYPYTDFHELNLDWIIGKIRELDTTMTEFMAVNQITFRGNWDSTTRYPIWSMVDDGSGNGYIAIQEVPAGTSLTNTDYWRQVASYANIYAAFNTRVAALETTVGSSTSGLVKAVADNTTDIATNTAAIASLNTQINALEHKQITTVGRYYVNGATGSDSNNGTSALPWQTLAPLFKLANSAKNGKADIRCYIMSAGTYDVPNLGNDETVFTGLAIHITGNVDGVILRFPSTNHDVKIYECHCNFDNLTFTTTGGAGIAFDGGSVSLDSCTFTERLICYGVQGIIEDCYYPSALIKYSVVYLEGNTITNTDNTVDAYEIDCSKVAFGGTCPVSELSSAGSTNAFIKGWDSDIVFKPTFRSLTNKYGYSISGYGFTVISDTTNYNYFTSRAVNGINNSDTAAPNVFIHSATGSVVITN